LYVRSTVTGRKLPLLGGVLCLDFVNTVDPRLKAPQEDFLPTFATLAEWGQFAGLLTAAQKRAMRAEGVADPLLAEDIHRRAIELREALFRLFHASQPLDSQALDILNAELERASMGLAVQRFDGGYRLTWRSTAASDRLLGPVARSAAELLASPKLHHVRECAGEGCGWLFLDSSKAHRRRWCSMAGCGNRAKAQRHRQRAPRKTDRTAR
jgi:predicted RNA-binding Zn ribbon-like protein